MPGSSSERSAGYKSETLSTGYGPKAMNDRKTINGTTCLWIVAPISVPEFISRSCIDISAKAYTKDSVNSPKSPMHLHRMSRA
ncbi:hypothetical protein JTB14_034663 [Gonioctena quinquepunctata]|nr:hypothetical protein JTB14_034663 [Gonioctena quinquepunctata]